MTDSIVASAQQLCISDIPSDDLLVFRESLIEQEREVLADIRARRAEIEAEIHARITRNGGRALLAQRSGVTLKAELTEQWTPYAYDVDGLRQIAAKLPASEACKIVKHIEELVTVVPAHDEPGNPRSITALIKQYGEQSEIGASLAGCMKRSKVGEKLTVTAEAA